MAPGHVRCFSVRFMFIGSRSLRPPAALPLWPASLLVVLVTLAVIGAGGALVYRTDHEAAPAHPAERAATVYFAPGDTPTAAIVEQLGAARRSVHVQAYSFTSAPIARALVEAERRGVEVEAVLDKSNATARYSSADFLAHEGVATFIDGAHAIAHNKVMIIDGAVVLTGSFNFTKAAEEKNAENLLVLRDPALASEYEANWEKHRAHSQRYQGK
jgi:phosphatidylserine/phosphatidylglycerophosphate/cardiolipin synthase-like enzyme